jgi:predicted dehydrogenase
MVAEVFSMARTRRIGLIGCGFFARNHLHAWKQLAPEGAVLAAVCDSDANKSNAAARDFGISAAYTDAAEMFAAEQLDAVDIVTQVRSHRPLVEIALRAGIPTIVQKPFGSTLAECAAMTELSRSLGISLAVHENFRFQLVMQTVREVLLTGEIGTPNWARIGFRTGYNVYAGQPYLLTEEKFVINDLGTHVLDLARFFLGEVAYLSAETQKRRPDLAGEDTATMLLRHKSGAVSVVECTYEARRLPDVFPQTLVEIEGSDGAVVVKSGCIVEVTSGGKLRTLNADPPLAGWMERPWHAVQDSVLRACAHFLECLESGESPITAASDNLKTVALCSAAYAAAAARSSVAPEY